MKRSVEIGDAFGYWTVIGDHPGVMVLCRCSCGLEKLVNRYNLKDRKTTSCGCAMKYDSAVKHGLSKTPEYQIWKAMKARCYGVNHKNYPDYGGRGIKVCEKWKHDFAAFFADMGERPTAAHSIDRIDNDQDYAPHNCKWSTQKEQTSNTRRTVTVQIGGKTKSISEIEQSTGIKSSTLYHRIAAGCSESQLVRPIYGTKL